MGSEEHVGGVDTTAEWAITHTALKKKAGEPEADLRMLARLSPHISHAKQQQVAELGQRV